MPLVEFIECVILMHASLVCNFVISGKLEGNGVSLFSLIFVLSGKGLCLRYLFL